MRTILVFALSCSLIFGFTQDKLYTRGSLYIGADFGFGRSSAGATELSALIFSNNQLNSLSGGLILDYKFVKSPGGLITSLNYQAYTYEGIKIGYLSIPTIAYLRFGKQVQFQFGAGLSQNVQIHKTLDQSNLLNQTFEDSRRRYALGLTTNLGLLFQLPSPKHRLGLYYFLNRMLQPAFDTLIQQGPSGGSYASPVRLLGHRITFSYAIRIFDKKEE